MPFTYSPPLPPAEAHALLLRADRRNLLTDLQVIREARKRRGRTTGIPWEINWHAEQSATQWARDRLDSMGGLGAVW